MNAKKTIVKEGDVQRLNAYVAENKEALQVEVNRFKAEATVALNAAKSKMPASMDDWLETMDGIGDQFRDIMAGAREMRKPVSERIHPMDGLSSEPRLNPSQLDTHSPEWAHLKSGAYAFQLRDGAGFPCFVTGVGYSMWVWPWRATPSSRQAEMRLDICLHEWVRPLQTWLATTFGGDVADVKAWSLEIKATAFDAKFVMFDIEGAEAVERPPPGVRKKHASCEEGGEESGPFLGTEEVGESWQDDQIHDSDGWPSVISDEESESAGTVSSSGTVKSAEDDVSPDDVAHRPPRAARGTFVMAGVSNIYFTFTNNVMYADITVRAVRRWGIPGELGTANLSKSLIPTKFGATKESPGACLLALRAWMVGKARENGFCNRKSWRRRAFSQMLLALRRDICDALNIMTTGNADADALIWGWAPDALDAP